MLDVELFSDCAADAREALHHLALRPYSVMLLDLDIVGGSETIIAAVSKMANSQQPIIFATAADRIGRIDAEGVQVVMRRPLRVREVAELTRACIDASARQRRKAVARDDELHA